MSAIQSTSEAWKLARVGHVTASRIADIVARTKSGYSASRANYLAQLVAERLTGVPMEGFTSPAMQWGLDTEAEAVAAYGFAEDCDVVPGDFVLHPRIGMSGATPDGYVGDTGLVEIKCPNTSTHIETLLGGVIPAKYQHQMLWQMACTGRNWCDFVSFDPRLPERLRLFVRRVHRDDNLIADLEAEVTRFLTELETTLGQLAALGVAA